MKTRTARILSSSIAGALLASLPAQGAVYIGSGKWEVATNWDTGRVPGDNGTGGLEQQNIVVLGDSEIDFDAATWAYLSSNGLLHSATE